MKTAKLTLVLFFLLFLLRSGQAYCAGDASLLQSLKSNWGMEQNLGQLRDPSGKNLDEIKYFGKNGAVQIYCRTNSFSFVFMKNQLKGPAVKSIKDYSFKHSGIPAYAAEVSRIDMVFEGANPGTAIVGEEKMDLLKNYFIQGHSNLTGVASYKKLTWKDIYPHIDLVLLVKAQSLEYEFIVHPGGRSSDIKILKNGQDAIQMLNDGGIKYSTAAGTLTEGKPKSFIGQKGIGSSFIRSGNSFSFHVEAYDHQKELVIDPDLTWATYYGGGNEDEAEGIITDAAGNVFISGTTMSTSGIATKGAYQTSISGGLANYDVFVAGFNSNGVPVWATYYGGDTSDVGVGMAIDKSGNLYVTGFTVSLSGIASSGAYQTKLSGNGSTNDAFLAKFSNTGAMLWSTYFGGSGNENGYSITVDAGGNPVIFGTTSGGTGLTTSGAYQTSFGGGGGDAFLAKFNSNGNLKWATYYGGYGYDAGYGIAADASGNLFVTGVSTSPVGMATGGAWKMSGDSVNGNAYVAKFDSTGNIKWGTYYGGNGGDLGFFIATLPSGEVAITGMTGSSSGIATGGAYQKSLAGTSNVFLADFSTTGSVKWGTYYGGEGQDIGYGLASDNSGNLYVTGASISTKGIATSGAYQTSNVSANGGVPDAFMAKFTAAGALKYGTYYGGSDQDVGLAICVDNSGNIYMTGGTASTDKIASSGSYSSGYNGGSFDAFVAKFYLCNLTTYFTGKDSVCINGTASYKAVDHANTAFVWTVTGGSVLSGAGTDSIVVKWTGKNYGYVTAKEVNSVTACRDSLILPVFINPLPTPSIIGSEVVCGGKTITYQTFSTPGNSYAWTVSGGTVTGSTKNDSVVVKWPMAVGSGKIIVNETSAAGCVNKDSTGITIDGGANAKWKVKNNGGGSYRFAALDSAAPGISYKWNAGDSAKGTGYAFIHNYAHNGSYKVVLIAANGTCTDEYDSTITITNAAVQHVLAADFGLKVYPNPFSGRAEISYHLNTGANVKISLFDMLGKEVIKICDGNLSAGDHVIVLNDASNIAPGTYMLKIQVDNIVANERILKIAR
jgi:hypothetical protein